MKRRSSLWAARRFRCRGRRWLGTLEGCSCRRVLCQSCSTAWGAHPPKVSLQSLARLATLPVVPLQCVADRNSRVRDRLCMQATATSIVRASVCSLCLEGFVCTHVAALRFDVGLSSQACVRSQLVQVIPTVAARARGLCCSILFAQPGLGFGLCGLRRRSAC